MNRPIPAVVIAISSWSSYVHGVLPTISTNSLLLVMFLGAFSFIPPFLATNLIFKRNHDEVFIMQREIASLLLMIFVLGFLFIVMIFLLMFSSTLGISEGIKTNPLYLLSLLLTFLASLSMTMALYEITEAFANYYKAKKINLNSN